MEDVFPGFNVQDRIGIVVKDFCGATGASTLIMAAITKFYDFYRPQLGNEKNKLRIYPEYFLFHIGKRFGDHQQMDIWPSHREVIVENNAEKILQAINDRAITRLLVVDSYPSQSTEFMPETLNSAKQRIITTLAYSSTGRVEQADILAASTTRVERYVMSTLNESKQGAILSEYMYDRLQNIRHSLFSDEHIKETYRKVSLTEALHMLT